MTARRRTLLLAALALTVLLGVVPGAGGQTQETDEIFTLWQDAAFLRGQQQYPQAEAVLRGIVADYGDTENVLRRAWCEILFTLVLAGDKAEQEAAAREALRSFPDLQADPVYIPPTVNTLLEDLRRQMFGSLAIKEPEGAEVFLGDAHIGTVPVFLPYVEVGEYQLRALKDGYEDYAEWFSVDPDGRHQYERIPMKRHKGLKYWGTLGGGAVLVGTIVYYAARGEDSTGPSALGDPPAAPGAK